MKNRFANIDFLVRENCFKREAHLKSYLVYGDLNTPVPTYTIIIPTLRRAELVEETLKSAINQNKFKDYEIVVLDIDPEKNTDTEKLMGKYKKCKNIFYYRCEEELIGWNRGLELARTKWVTVLGDDDLLMPNYLNSVDEIIKKYPEAEGIAPKYDIFFYDFEKKKNIPFQYGLEDNKQKFSKKIKTFLRKYKLIPPKKTSYKIGKYVMDNYYLRDAAFAPLCVMYKRENMMKLGGWNIDFEGSMDFILNVNYMLKYNLLYTTEALGRKREGQGNLSSSSETKIGFALLAYLFYTNSIIRSNLKFLEIDNWFIQATVFYMALVEMNLDFNDINEDGYFQEEYYNKECIHEFRAKWSILAEQLLKANPIVDSYLYSPLNHKLIWK